jgi:hypothetical protein
MLNSSVSPLPGPQDTLLLRAALLSGRPALDAFAEWRRTLDLDALDFGSQRVLPLLASNLRAHGVDDPLTQRFRGVSRFAWFLNNVLVEAARPVLKELHRSKIPFLLLKGIAFIAALPDQLPMRAMTDIDLLVHPQDAKSAIEILETTGWRPYYGRGEFVSHELVDRVINCDFQTGQIGHLDLHWYVNPQNRWTSADAAFWDRRIQVQFGGERCYAPCLEDQVLHAFVHGAPWNGVGTIRWATDSTIILRHAGARFDWPYFLTQVRTRRVALQARNCLRFLRDRLDVQVPQDVMSKLDREHVSLVETLDYRLRARNPATLNRVAGALLSFQNYRGSDETLEHARDMTALRRWIRYSWGANSVLEASALALLAAVRHPPWLRSLISRIWRRDGMPVRLGRRGAPNLQDGPLDLSLSGDPKGALLAGWSEPEANGRWTDGREAALALDLGTARCAVTLEVTISAMVAPGAPRLRVEIWINRRRLEDWLFEQVDALPHVRTVTILDKALADRCQVLTFVIRNPTSPRSLGISSDTRQLGIFVHKLKLQGACGNLSH